MDLPPPVGLPVSRAIAGGARRARRGAPSSSAGASSRRLVNFARISRFLRSAREARIRRSRRGSPGVRSQTARITSVNVAAKSAATIPSRRNGAKRPSARRSGRTSFWQQGATWMCGIRSSTPRLIASSVAVSQPWSDTSRSNGPSTAASATGAGREGHSGEPERRGALAAGLDARSGLRSTPTSSRATPSFSRGVMVEEESEVGVPAVRVEDADRRRGAIRSRSGPAGRARRGG